MGFTGKGLGFSRIKNGVASQNRCHPPIKPSAVVVEYVSPITGSKIVVIRGSLRGSKKGGKPDFVTKNMSRLPQAVKSVVVPFASYFSYAKVLVF